MNMTWLLKALAMFGGSITPESTTRWKTRKTYPSEVAHLSKAERKKRRRIQHLSTRKR